MIFLYLRSISNSKSLSAMEQQLKDIVSHFAIEGEVRDIHPLGNGLINTPIPKVKIHVTLIFFPWI